MTLRLKLIILYAALLTVIILMFGTITFAAIRSIWIESVDQTLRETVNLVINNSTSALVGDFSGPRTIQVQLPPLDTFRASGVMVQAWQTDEEEAPKFVVSSANLRDYSNPLDPNTLGASELIYSNVITSNGTELRVLTAPVSLTGRDAVFGSVQAAVSLHTVNVATSKLAVIMVVGGAIGVGISIFLGAWLSHQALEPIGAIIQAADSISTAEDLRTRLPEQRHMDELGMLTTVLNRMLKRIEDLFSVQQRFVADVSHELRTPLTVIQGNLEMIERYGLEPELMEAVKDETGRMARLVIDLLLLARADYGGMKLDLIAVDLDTILVDVYHEGHILIKNRDLSLILGSIEPARVMGNPDRLKQLVLNLVGNAIKFTPDGGTITLSLQVSRRNAYLSVCDTGVGISAEDQKHIFDRFYQTDTSRTHAKHDGSGLGLSIAQWIANAHDGKLTVKSTLGEGTTFTVILPLMQASDSDEADADKTVTHLFARPRLPLPRRRKTPEAQQE
ncbi:MAG: HAMP domain-containing histidine kinase [Anaerolineaceae bacterium]|nr:HAMP domain-containing histidine kinase [Anaerolineaceae bacterium]